MSRVPILRFAQNDRGGGADSRTWLLHFIIASLLEGSKSGETPLTPGIYTSMLAHTAGRLRRRSAARPTCDCSWLAASWRYIGGYWNFSCSYSCRATGDAEGS